MKKLLEEKVVEITNGVLSGVNEKGARIVDCGVPTPMFNYYDLMEAGLSPGLCPPNSVFLYDAALFLGTT